MLDNCKNEILELHEFFESWLNGSIPLNENEIKRVDSCLTNDFKLISPSGDTYDKPTLISGINSAHGSRKGVNVKIKNINGQTLTDDLCLFLYEEWQVTLQMQRVRLSTAIFQYDETAPNYVSWLHLHESWLKKHNK